MSRGSVKAMMVGFTPGVLIVVIGFLGLSSLTSFIVSFLGGIAVLIALWFGLTRGTYITIDEDDRLYNTFLFIKRDVIPLSAIISLDARHPLLLSGKITKVWNTYRNDKGKLVAKSLVSRQTLQVNEFRDLIDTIQRANPNITIADELLK